MSFPDPPPPPHPYISLPFPGGDGAAGFWPPFLMENEQPTDLIFQFNCPPPFKRLRNSEFPPLPPMNPRTYLSNASGNRGGTGHMFYKTRICAKFMEGTCRNGDHCTFAHGPEDLREPPPNWQELVREKDRRSLTGSVGSGEDQRTSQRMKVLYKPGEESGFRGRQDFLQERPSPPRFTKSTKSDDGPKQRESFAISIEATSDARGRRSFSSYDQYDSKYRNSAIDSSEDRRGKTGFWRTKRGQDALGERCHFGRGHSGTGFETELVIDSNSVPARPMSVSVYSAAPANLLIDSQLGQDTTESKWKLNRKINRIYADWLDDQSPPYLSPRKDD